MFKKQKITIKDFRFHPGSWVVLAVLIAGLAVQGDDPLPPTHPEAAVNHPAPKHLTEPVIQANTTPPQQESIAAQQKPTSNQQPAAELSNLASRLPAPKAGTSYTEYPYTALLSPSDTLQTSQWHLTNIGARGTWDRWTGSSTTTIAIIDTGFALSHEDLSAKWKLNSAEMGSTAVQGPAPNCTSQGLALDKRCNNIDDDSNGYTDDWRGWDFVAGDNTPQAGSQYPSGAGAHHGTYVAGLAAAQSNNSKGVAGIDWGAQILPLQVLDDNGNGYTSEVAEAIEYAANAGADVINLSLGSPYDDATVRAKIAYAQSLGVTVVVAAGNEGCAGCITYPANYPEVIAVGASNQQDTRASFSSWGANLDLVAPGAGGLCSTTWSVLNGLSGYSCSGQGTSYAAPIVSGAAALLASRNTSLTPAQISELLTGGADKLAAMSTAFSQEYGYGRLNLLGSIMQLATPIDLDGGATGAVISQASSNDLVTICRGTAGSCRLRFVGPADQVVLSPTMSLNQWGDAAFQWQPEDFGLTNGVWTVGSAYYDGSPSGLAATTITITN